MIEFKAIKEKELLVHYANEFGDSNILKVLSLLLAVKQKQWI